MEFNKLLDILLDSVSALSDNEIDAKIKSLDWNQDPNLSPYQVTALDDLVQYALESPKNRIKVHHKLGAYVDYIKSPESSYPDNFMPCTYYQNIFTSKNNLLYYQKTHRL